MSRRQIARCVVAYGIIACRMIRPSDRAQFRARHLCRQARIARAVGHTAGRGMLRRYRRALQH